MNRQIVTCLCALIALNLTIWAQAPPARGTGEPRRRGADGVAAELRVLQSPGTGADAAVASTGLPQSAKSDPFHDLKEGN